MHMGVKEFALKTNGMEMDCISFGRGSKPLVMIQGLNTNGIRGAGRSLAWMYRIFAKDHRVYLFDRRRDLPENVTVRELAEDTALAMDALGLKNADVLGVSLGGMMAQYLAIDRPDLVDRLALAVTACKSGETVTEAIRCWMQLAESGSWQELVRDMAERMYSEAYLKRYRPLLPLLTAVQKPKDVPRFLTLCKACLTCDTVEELHKITCPTLVIGGKADRVVGGNACRELAEKLHGKCILYEELGHAAYEEAKDFNRQVYDFFRQK